MLLADEPAAHLDPAHQLRLMELLRAEAARGTAVVVTLHDLSLASRFCDRIVVMTLAGASSRKAMRYLPERRALRSAVSASAPGGSKAASCRGKEIDDDKPEQDEHYKKALYDLQVELVKLQRDLIASNATRARHPRRPRCRRQRRHHQAPHRAYEPARNPRARAGQTVRAAKIANGISSVSCRSCRRRGISWCSTAPGTIAPVSSG